MSNSSEDNQYLGLSALGVSLVILTASISVVSQIGFQTQHLTSVSQEAALSGTATHDQGGDINLQLQVLARVTRKLATVRARIVNPKPGNIYPIVIES